ncbi:MAG: hypothetical protein CEO12_168 [Parcubacteria group bacterium Gr01-1014_46]|nr:MAG: hypothetical protein CEO12_168 [Parcubacteria group bacterium Gr01-1014_46]
MTRLVRIFVLALAVTLVASTAMAQKGQFVAPVNAELDKFPIYNDVLTVAQMAKHELTVKVLTEPTVVHNHFRGLHGKDGRFVLELLPTGTIVLVDKDGRIRYKADCGNRLSEMPPPPAPVLGPATPVPCIPEILPLAPKQSGWSWFWGGMWNFLAWIANGLGGLLAGIWHCLWFLLTSIGWLFLLALILWLTWRLLRYLFGGNQQNNAWGGGNNPPAPVAPLVTPRQTATPPPAPTPSAVAPSAIPVVAGPLTTPDRSFLNFNPGDVGRPDMLTWGGRITPHSYEDRPDGSHALRFYRR